MFLRTSSFYIYTLLPRTAATVILATQPYTFLYVPSCTFTSLFFVCIILSILFLRVSRSQNIYSFARCFQDTHIEDSIFLCFSGAWQGNLLRGPGPGVPLRLHLNVGSLQYAHPRSQHEPFPLLPRTKYLVRIGPQLWRVKIPLALWKKYLDGVRTAGRLAVIG